jgi:Tfp pilus assembly protein PilX
MQRWRRPSDHDDGFALVVVIAAMFVLSLLVSTTLYYTTQNISNSRRAQNYEAALAAAQAGVEDYLNKLDLSNTYWQNNNVDATNTALVNPADSTTANNWKTVPGYTATAADANAAPQYQYHIVQTTQQVLLNGLITLAVTGRVRGVERTVYADLRQQSFLNFGYYTDKETVDPELYPALTGVPYTEAVKYCNHYYYSTDGTTSGTTAGRAYQSIPATDTANGPYAGSTMSCLDPVFTGSDVVNGPLYTNDAINVYGHPTFKSTAYSNWTSADKPAPTSSKIWRAYTGSYSSDSPLTNLPQNPTQTYTMPPSNSQLSTLADGTKGGLGCLYTGPTYIQPTTTGGWYVYSPNTKSTNAGCYTTASGANGTAQLITPSSTFNGVIYVQSIPTLSTDPNYTASGSCQNLGTITVGAAKVTPVLPNDTGTQDTCVSGDLFTQGDQSVSGGATLHGQFTFGADNDIVVLGSLSYSSATSSGTAVPLTSTDVLGLVANGFVEVNHQVTCTTTTGVVCTQATGSCKAVTIDAAILSVLHSFIVQNYWVGPSCGTLTVVGAIDQEFRGAVGSTAPTGYTKNYIYDTRLERIQPPGYLDPTEAQWQITDYSEQHLP